MCLVVESIIFHQNYKKMEEFIMKIIKRDGTVVPFDKKRIEIAIGKAMDSTGILKHEVAKKISIKAEEYFSKQEKTPSIYDVEKYVYEALLENDLKYVARWYEGYRAVQTFKREQNTTDNSILGLVERLNTDVMNENSNKDGMLCSTQRDLIAGEISKDISRRKLIPSHLLMAHDEGVLHIHDLDYFLNDMFNCCLVNIKDMLDNGTVINKKMVESPKSFQTACTILTQIIAQISSGQFGGQTINVKHLGKYLRKSYDRYMRMLKETISDEALLKETCDKLLQKELEAGIQTIQYQIQTLSSTNGQFGCL